MISTSHIGASASCLLSKEALVTMQADTDTIRNRTTFHLLVNEHLSSWDPIPCQVSFGFPEFYAVQSRHSIFVDMFVSRTPSELQDSGSESSDRGAEPCLTKCEGGTLLIINISIIDLGRKSNYAFVARVSSLLRLAREALQDRDIEAEEARAEVPWAAWGPQHTRCFKDIKFSRDASLGWRLATPELIYDFNPGRSSKDDHGRSAVTKPSIFFQSYKPLKFYYEVQSGIAQSFSSTLPFRTTRLSPDMARRTEDLILGDALLYVFDRNSRRLHCYSISALGI